MFDFFSFHCCQDVIEDNIEFDLEIKNTLSSSRTLEEELNEIKTSLKTNLCLFTIYSSTKELLPFNELKIDEQMNAILSKKYFEIYKKSEELISQTFIKTFSLPSFSVISMIISLDENNEENFKLIDYLKDENVTRHNVKKLLKLFQYLLYKPPPEPDESDPNCCNITFRFIDESFSFCRRYHKNTKVKELYFIISSKYPEIIKFRLFKISPEEELKEVNNTLEQENLYPSGLIQVIS